MHFLAKTSCDSTSSFSGIGKKKAFKTMLESDEYQDSLGNLGNALPLDENTAEKCEKFVCNFYTKAKKAGTTVMMLGTGSFVRIRNEAQNFHHHMIALSNT